MAKSKKKPRAKKDWGKKGKAETQLRPTIRNREADDKDYHWDPMRPSEQNTRDHGF